MGPEDMGSDEEDKQDYVHSMLGYTCIGYEVAVLGSAIPSWALRLSTLTKGVYTISLASGPIFRDLCWAVRHDCMRTITQAPVACQVHLLRL